MSTRKQEHVDGGVALADAPETPPSYHVIFKNDDYTPFEFVIAVVMSVFHKNIDAAELFAAEVHKNGQGIAGTYTKEIADSKCEKTLKLARAHQHPLRVLVIPAEPSFTPGKPKP